MNIKKIIGIALISGFSFFMGGIVSTALYDTEPPKPIVKTVVEKVVEVKLIYIDRPISESVTVTEDVSSKNEVTIESVESEIITPLNGKDKELLARLVMAEAQGEPYEGKVAVAEVVLNRVDSKRFPNSVKGVIYQEGQFTPVYNGHINKKPNEDSIKAVEEVMKLDRENGLGSLFFYNPKTSTVGWHKVLKLTETIGNHEFSKY